MPNFTSKPKRLINGTAKRINYFRDFCIKQDLILFQSFNEINFKSWELQDPKKCLHLASCTNFRSFQSKFLPFCFKMSSMTSKIP